MSNIICRLFKNALSLRPEPSILNLFYFCVSGERLSRPLFNSDGAEYEMRSSAPSPKNGWVSDGRDDAGAEAEQEIGVEYAAG
jgi:hypothetical protein